MQIRVAILFALLSGPAMCFPGPDLFARAELKAIADYSGKTPFIFAGDIVSIEKEERSTIGDSTYLVHSSQGMQHYCVVVTVSSRMGEKRPGQISSDEVIAKVKTVKKVTCD